MSDPAATYKNEMMKAMLDNAMFNSKPPPMMISFESIGDALSEYYSDYNFRVNNSDDINFKKIADDLSYADPLRIVEFGDKMWAVVHHTIQDKYIRSILYGSRDIPRQPIHLSIMSGVTSILPKDIVIIVNCIRKIKQAQWTDDKKYPPVGPIVEVKKMKI